MEDWESWSWGSRALAAALMSSRSSRKEVLRRFLGAAVAERVDFAEVGEKQGKRNRWRALILVMVFG